MSNITKFFASDAPERKKHRRIFQGNTGITTFTWPAPDNTTEVEVHCWGAGGSGNYMGGGGGGGYVTHVFPVSSGDVFQITIGASPGGTSSVSIPTQTPSSPISATGGGQAGGSPPGTGTPAPGGVGSFTIAPGISTARTFTAPGGSGGTSTNAAYNPTFAAPVNHGGGGAAGTPQGKGGDGSPGGGGGGIGRPGYGTAGGGSIGPAQQGLYGPSSPDQWFYVEEIFGSVTPNGAGSGCGGNGSRSNAVPSTPAGFFGGGGGGYFQSGSYYGPSQGAGSSIGGIAAGGGGINPYGSGVGGTGIVIMYW